MSLSVLSYAAAAIAYGVLLFLLLLSRESTRRGEWVMTAVAAAALWGLGVVVGLALYGDDPPANVVYVADTLRTWLWVLCLLAALPGRVQSFGIKGILLGAASLLAAFSLLDYVVLRSESGMPLALLGLSVLGCLTIEQIFRNTTDEDKTAIRAFLRTIGAVLVFDLFVFSDAVLLGRINPNLWALRGLVAAGAVPFLLLSAKRHPDWSQTLFISREVVFYSATLTGIGLYFLAMALGAFVIRQQGGEWSAAIQATYFVAVFAVLAFVLSSGRWKNALRVFISKHFYRNRYDYREEWLRLIRTLSDETDAVPIEERSIKALAAIINGRSGQMWLKTDRSGTYEPFAAWGSSFPSRALALDSRLARFLVANRWVIDGREYEEDPEVYEYVFRDDALDLWAASVIVPLFHQNEMLGITRLDASHAPKRLNYEDHDLLKTAGRQVAAFLAHDIAKERLAETQQFEAYSKFSAFVMHDLKNLLAQQALLVQNAKKFGDRPEFMADVIDTVDNGVQRMRRLLRQLKQGAPVSQDLRVELNKVLLKAVSACTEIDQVPCKLTENDQLWVYAKPDELTSVLIHIIQNAQEATSNGSTVSVELAAAVGGRAEIRIQDHGDGMSEEFMRKHLFKPFATTKGVAGMGIGVYQARELVRGLGGDMEVASELNVGTTVRILLPLAETRQESQETSSSTA